MSPKQTIKLSIVTTLAGIIYCSWPLGYVLSPVASKGLASNLGALHQPYNWVFIGGDIVAGSLMVLVALWWLQRAPRLAQWARLSLVGVIIFGVGSALDAALPLHCIQTSTRLCPSFTVDHLLLLHGVCSIAASLFLFVSVLLIWLQNRRRLGLLLIMIGYVAFLLFSILDAVQNRTSNLSQHYYITLCSVIMAAYPYLLSRALRVQPVVREEV